MKRISEIRHKREAQFIKNRCVLLLCLPLVQIIAFPTLHCCSHSHLDIQSNNTAQAPRQPRSRDRARPQASREECHYPQRACRCVNAVLRCLPVPRSPRFACSVPCPCRLTDTLTTHTLTLARSYHAVSLPLRFPFASLTLYSAVSRSLSALAHTLTLTHTRSYHTVSLPFRCQPLALFALYPIG